MYRIETFIQSDLKCIWASYSSSCIHFFGDLTPRCSTSWVTGNMNGYLYVNVIPFHCVVLCKLDIMITPDSPCCFLRLIKYTGKNITICRAAGLLKRQKCGVKMYLPYYKDLNDTRFLSILDERVLVFSRLEWSVDCILELLDSKWL